jgi:hypothetical protein
MLKPFPFLQKPYYEPFKKAKPSHEDEELKYLVVFLWFRFKTCFNEKKLIWKSLIEIPSFIIMLHSNDCDVWLQ